MDKSELTAKMLEWEQKSKELSELETVIKREVMRLEESFQAGNVYARFMGGRRTFDYASVGKTAPQDVIEKNTKTVVTTDWSKVCKDANITDIPVVGISNPSVSLSIKE